MHSPWLGTVGAQPTLALRMRKAHASNHAPGTKIVQFLGFLFRSGFSEIRVPCEPDPSFRHTRCAWFHYTYWPRERWVRGKRTPGCDRIIKTLPPRGAALWIITETEWTTLLRGWTWYGRRSTRHLATWRPSREVRHHRFPTEQIRSNEIPVISPNYAILPLSNILDRPLIKGFGKNRTSDHRKPSLFKIIDIYLFILSYSAEELLEPVGFLRLMRK